MGRAVKEQVVEGSSFRSQRPNQMAQVIHILRPLETQALPTVQSFANVTFILSS